MNNTRIYKERECHYNRLVNRLSKAQNKGGSKSLQARLSARLERCLMQLKQLSTGVAVLAALGWTAPVIAQSNNTVPLSYVEKTGVDNPFDTISVDFHDVCFADIDSDGDQDMIGITKDFTSATAYHYTFKYYKNIGTSTMPKFELETSNPFSNLLDQYTTSLSFVDIDQDSDLDLFTSKDSYLSGDTISIVHFYKNTSLDPTNPTYTLVPAIDNPLQKAADYYNGLNLTYPASLYFNFIDVDGDGNQDCFIGAGFGPVNASDAVVYYKNTGTPTNANFELQTFANNPLSDVSAIWNQSYYFSKKFFVFDGDLRLDGDLDVGVLVNNPAAQPVGFHYFQNTEVQGKTKYVLSNTTPMDSIILNYGVQKLDILGVVDLTNNGRAEILFKESGSNSQYRYFVDTVSYTNLLIERGARNLNSYPNPSTGLIRLNQVLTGKLRVCNLLGQEVYSRELVEAQQLDLSTLNDGVYILHILTKEDDYVQEVMITRK